MESWSIKIIVLSLLVLVSFSVKSQDFQGKAYYYSKSTMELGKWGAKLSAQQKKQVQERLKNRLEKTYILTFNKEESYFKEDEKLDAMSGATDSWGQNFTPGPQYKNVKDNLLMQEQEFYGKKFLIKDALQKLDWVMGDETKMIGNYTCFKAVTVIPDSELNWWSFSWDKLRNQEKNESSEKTEETDIEEIPMTQIVAWYSPQIPISQGPLEYWGLPGLILEVDAGETKILCTKIVLNPKEKAAIDEPSKGKVVTQKEYDEIVEEKTKEMRERFQNERQKSGGGSHMRMRG